MVEVIMPPDDGVHYVRAHAGLPQDRHQAS
jgi:hypothetical protein